MDQIKIGKFIIENRKKQNLTQEELAKKLGVTNRTVSNWENGKCMPEYSLLTSLTQILKISISELINGEREVTPIEEKKKVEKIIDFLKYIENQKDKYYKKIGKLIFFIGILMILIVLLFIPSNFYESKIYIFAGMIISFVGLLYLTHKENVLKIVLLSISFIIGLTAFLLFQDYVNVKYFKSPPRYQMELDRKIFTGHVYYQTPLYDVYACEKNMFVNDIGKEYIIVAKDKSMTSYEKIIKYCNLKY